MVYPLRADLSVGLYYIINVSGIAIDRDFVVADMDYGCRKVGSKINSNSGVFLIVNRIILEVFTNINIHSLYKFYTVCTLVHVC